MKVLRTCRTCQQEFYAPPKSSTKHKCRTCSRKKWEENLLKNGIDPARVLLSGKILQTPENKRRRLILDAKERVCAICGRPEEEEVRLYGRRLSLDHDHETGLVRDYLCGAHNKALGLFRDDPEHLMQAACYLEEHREATQLLLEGPTATYLLPPVKQAWELAMAYEVQKNIPIPTHNSGMGRNERYGWDRLKEAGDSIFIPESELEKGKTLKDMRTSIYNAARKYGSKHGIQFLALVTEEKQTAVGEHTETSEMVKGVRVWRLDENGQVPEPVPEEPIRTQEGSQLSDNERQGGIDAEAA